jgi:hypothetical protein
VVIEISWLTVMVGVFGVFTVKAIDIGVEMTRRSWEERQKSRAKWKDAAAALIGAAITTETSYLLATRRAPAEVDRRLDVAVLEMLAFGAPAELVTKAKSICHALTCSTSAGSIDHDLVRKLLRDFATEMGKGFGAAQD